MARDCIKIAMWSKSWSRWKHLIKHMGSEPMCERFRDVWDPKQPLAMQKIYNEGTVLVKQYTVFFFFFFFCAINRNLCSEIQQDMWSLDHLIQPIDGSI